MLWVDLQLLPFHEEETEAWRQLDSCGKTPLTWQEGRAGRGSQEGPLGAGGEGDKGRGLRGPEASFNEGCVHPGTRIGASPTHTCLSWSLRVTLWGGVAKWGGAKLPGSSVNLAGNREGPEGRSVPLTLLSGDPGGRLCSLTSGRSLLHTPSQPRPWEGTQLQGALGVCLTQSAWAEGREALSPQTLVESRLGLSLAAGRCPRCSVPHFPIGKLDTVILRTQGCLGGLHKVLNDLEKKKSKPGLAPDKH